MGWFRSVSTRNIGNVQHPTRVDVDQRIAVVESNSNGFPSFRRAKKDPVLESYESEDPYGDRTMKFSAPPTRHTPVVRTQAAKTIVASESSQLVTQHARQQDFGEKLTIDHRDKSNKWKRVGESRYKPYRRE